MLFQIEVGLDDGLGVFATDAPVERVGVALRDLRLFVDSQVPLYRWVLVDEMREEPSVPRQGIEARPDYLGPRAVVGGARSLAGMIEHLCEFQIGGGVVEVVTKEDAKLGFLRIDQHGVGEADL